MEYELWEVGKPQNRNNIISDAKPKPKHFPIDFSHWTLWYIISIHCALRYHQFGKGPLIYKLFFPIFPSITFLLLIKLSSIVASELASQSLSPASTWIEDRKPTGEDQRVWFILQGVLSHEWWREKHKSIPTTNSHRSLLRLTSSYSVKNVWVPNNAILLQLQQKWVFRNVCTYSHRHEEVSWDRTPHTKELLLLRLTN